MDNDSMDWTETSPLQTYTPPKCEIHSTEFLNAPRSSLKRPFAEVSDGTEPVDRNHYITSEDYAAAEHVVPQAVPAPWYAPVAKGLQWTALAIYVVGAVTTVVAMQASRLGWKGTRGIGRFAARQPAINHFITATDGVANTHKRLLVSYLVGPQVASPSQRRRGGNRIPGQFPSSPTPASPIFRQHGNSITYITPPRLGARRRPSPSQWAHDAFTTEVSLNTSPTFLREHGFRLGADPMDIAASTNTTIVNANMSEEAFAPDTAAPSTTSCIDHQTRAMSSHVGSSINEVFHQSQVTKSGIDGLLSSSNPMHLPLINTMPTETHSATSFPADNHTGTSEIERPVSSARSPLSAIAANRHVQRPRHNHRAPFVTRSALAKSNSASSHKGVSKLREYFKRKQNIAPTTAPTTAKKTVGFYESPVTGRPVSKFKHFIIGEPISYMEANSPTPATSCQPSVLESITYTKDDNSIPSQKLTFDPTFYVGDDNPTAKEQAALDAQLSGYAQDSSLESNMLGCGLISKSIEDPFAQSRSQLKVNSPSREAKSDLSTQKAGQCEISPEPITDSGVPFVQPGDQPEKIHAVPAAIHDDSMRVAGRCGMSPESIMDSGVISVQPGDQAEINHAVPAAISGDSTQTASQCEMNPESSKAFGMIFLQPGDQPKENPAAPEATYINPTQAAGQCEEKPGSIEDSDILFMQPGDLPKENFAVPEAINLTQAAGQCEEKAESIEDSGILFVQPGDQPKENPTVPEDICNTPVQTANQREPQPGVPQEAQPENIATSSPRTPSPSALGLEQLELSDRRKKARGRKEAARKAKEEKEKAELQAHLAREVEAKLLRDGIRRMPQDSFIQPLSNDWEHRLAVALKSSVNTVVGRTSKDVAITRKDIGTVLPQRNTTDHPNGWINDEIIAAYLQAVIDRGHDQHNHRPTRTNTPKLHAFNNFFYNNLKDGGYSKVERWAKKANIGGKNLLKLEYVFIPINLGGSHWTLGVVSPMRKSIEYFDSMHGSATAIIKNIKKWLKGELRDDYKDSEWKMLEDPAFKGHGKGPTQDNAKDCGIFTITTAKAIVLGVDPMAISATDMPLQRKRVVVEIMNGGFTGDLQPRVRF